MPVLVISLLVRIRLTELPERSVRRTISFHLINRQFIPEQQLIIQIVRQQESYPEAIPLGLLHHPGISLVIQINAITHALVSTFHVQRMLVSDGYFQRFRQPVRVNPFLHTLQTFRVIHPQQLLGRNIVRIVQSRIQLRL